MLSLCSSSSSIRHYCMVPRGICHWYRYFFLIICTLHLSFFVVVCSLTIVWIGWPSIRLSRGGGSFIVFSPCDSVGCGGFVMWASGGGEYD